MATGPAPALALDLSIGRGDNAPALVWAMPFAVAGSDFTLVVTIPRAGPAGPDPAMTLTVSGGGLALDAASNTVTWSVTSAQSAALASTNFYTLRRTAPEIRYYAQGRVFGLDGPVGPSSVTVTGDGAGSPTAPSLDLAIGRGDTAPTPTWQISFPVAGSDFQLTVSMPGGATVVRTASGGGLVIDPVANTIAWPVTPAESGALAAGYNGYTLRRIAPEVRYLARGSIAGVDGPVRASVPSVVVTGPMGPQGPAGPASTVPGPAGATGPKGDQGPPGTNPVYTAAAVISGDKALMFVAPGQVVHADPTQPGYVYAGIALTAAQPGSPVAAATFGDLTAAFWSWTPLAPVFVAPGGNLTQSPPAAGRSHLIGWALDAHTVHLAPDPIVTFV